MGRKSDILATFYYWLFNKSFKIAHISLKKIDQELRHNQGLYTKNLSELRSDPLNNLIDLLTNYLFYLILTLSFSIESYFSFVFLGKYIRP